MTDRPDPEEVLRYLQDVDYPASKDELIDAAERAGAPDAVVRSLRAIPPVDYRSRAEVARSVPVDPGADRPPGLAAAQARTRTPRVAEHLREPR